MIADFRQKFVNGDEKDSWLLGLIYSVEREGRRRGTDFETSRWMVG